MWVLYPRHRDVHVRSTQEQPRTHNGRDPWGFRGKPLSLHRLPSNPAGLQDLRKGRACTTALPSVLPVLEIIRIVTSIKALSR